MAVPCNVEFPRHPSFRNPCGINHSSKAVESSHQQLISSCVENLRLAPEPDKLVQDWCYPTEAHAKEERCTKDSELWGFKDRQERNQNCGNSQEGYKSQVEVAEEGVAHEGVVDRRVEGGRYKGSNSSIIKPEHDV